MRALHVRKRDFCFSFFVDFTMFYVFFFFFLLSRLIYYYTVYILYTAHDVYLFFSSALNFRLLLHERASSRVYKYAMIICVSFAQVRMRISGPYLSWGTSARIRLDSVVRVFTTDLGHTIKYSSNKHIIDLHYLIIFRYIIIIVFTFFMLVRQCDFEFYVKSNNRTKALWLKSVSNR